MQLLEGGARSQQLKAHPDARDVGVNWYIVQAVREQQHTGRRLAPHTGEFDR